MYSSSDIQKNMKTEGSLRDCTVQAKLSRSERNEVCSFSQQLAHISLSFCKDDIGSTYLAFSTEQSNINDLH